MGKGTPSDDDIHRMLHRVLSEWRSQRLAITQDMISNVQGRVDALEHSGAALSPDTVKMRSRLEEHAVRLADQRDDRIGMIEESYRKMSNFIDRRAREAE